MDPSSCVRRSHTRIRFGGFGRVLAGALLAGLLAAAPSTSLAAAEVLQGGFRFFDPQLRRGRVASLLSLGPLVLGGARERVSPSDGISGICKDIVLVMLGSEGSSRTGDSISLRQKAHVVTFFVFAECIGDEPICLQGASEPVAVAGCSGALKLRLEHGIEASAKVACEGGLPISDPGFDLSAQQRTWLSEAFPGIDRKFQIEFKDRDAEETTGDDLAFKIRNLDVDALDDIVGTYLADDELPGCKP